MNYQSVVACCSLDTLAQRIREALLEGEAPSRDLITGCALVLRGVLWDVQKLPRSNGLPSGMMVRAYFSESELRSCPWARTHIEQLDAQLSSERDAKGESI